MLSWPSMGLWRNFLDRMTGTAPPAERRDADVNNAINQRLFETSIDLILVVSRRGVLLRVSPSVRAILDRDPDEMQGRSAEDFLYPADLDSTRQEMRLARRGRTMRNFDCRYVHRAGHPVTLAWTGAWLEEEQQHIFIGRDMTDRIAAEDRARRSQRLEAVGQLTGGIAHDFNNLLAVVIGSLDLLQMRVAQDNEAVELAEAALKAALRGADLTRQLLAFARQQPLNAKVLAMEERIPATVSLLRRTLGERIEVVIDLSPDLWPALADPVQFEAALVNLAINARDAMPDGGRLSIDAENFHLDGDYARQNVDVTPGDYVMIAVSDTGGGMPPDIVARAFEPFFTTKPPGEGTGLGLSMVYGFIRQSRGHVKIYSEEGHGTTVRLYLPRAVDVSAPAAEQKAPALQTARRGERILVVEDNREVREVVLAQLGALGYRVIEAGNADEALGILSREEDIDLLFTDVVMPGSMSGDELARVARRQRPDLKVLLTSGFAKGSLHGGAQSDLASIFLPKPYRQVELAAKLRSILDASRQSL